MALAEFRFPDGSTVQVEMDPIAEYRDDLVRQVAQGGTSNPESAERSRQLAEGLLRFSSQQLVLLVGELSHVLLAYGREIRRLSDPTPPP